MPRLLTIAAALVLSQSACGRALTPRQNFDRMMNWYVGRPVSDEPRYRLLSSEHLVSAAPLADGEEIRRYVWKGPYGECSYSVVTDVTTREVKRWQLEGPAEPCSVPR